MEVWDEIPEFPDYCISNRGLILNTRTKRLMRQSKNQSGVVYVGLSKDGVQVKRSVAPMVARAFLPPPPSKRFNTVLHLDGNTEHNFVENLVWRPRPFVFSYRYQLVHPYHNRIHTTLQDVDTGELYEGSLDAAMRHGLLERAVVLSAMNEDYEVFPTGQRFRLYLE